MPPSSRFAPSAPLNPTALPVADILQVYQPPFELTSDMLIVFALARTAPLRSHFPEVPLLSVAGRTPLVMWFSRIRKIVYRHEGERRQLGGDEAVLYHELNVVALLRARAFFVPAIRATSGLTIQIGHRYGMPKAPGTMTLDGGERLFHSALTDGAEQSFVRARLFGRGRALGRLLARVWPQRIWPARFPDGREVRPQLLATPCVRPALVQGGQLALPVPWLPEPLLLLPLSLYLPDQVMRLPPPPDA